MAERNRAMFVAGGLLRSSVQYEEISSISWIYRCRWGSLRGKLLRRAAKAFISRSARLKSLVMLGTPMSRQSIPYTRFVFHELSTAPAFTPPESITPGCILKAHNYSGTRNPCAWLQSVLQVVRMFSYFYPDQAWIVDCIVPGSWL